MTTKWEYLIVVYYSDPTVRSKNAGTLFIHRAGTKSVEERRGGDWLALLNELGAQGWELISESHHETVVTGSVDKIGRSSQFVGPPFHSQSTFKRPVT